MITVEFTIIQLVAIMVVTFLVGMICDQLSANKVINARDRLINKLRLRNAQWTPEVVEDIKKHPRPPLNYNMIGEKLQEMIDKHSQENQNDNNT